MANVNNPNFPDAVPPLADEEDSGYDEGPVVDMVPKKQSQKKILTLDHITTEGLTLQDLEAMEYSGIKKKIKGCNFCGKYFGEDMCIPAFEKDDDVSCWHCFFWMNYAMTARKNADGVYGMTIVDYILRCSAIHETDKCQRNSDSGGCFLCEYNLGLPITDIKHVERLGAVTAASFGIPDKPNDDDDQIEVDRSQKTEQITVFI
ncbi:MAG: hypothetical protein Harvfovirus63_7 [Harvfovirus sp.]|uniref:Uncharacterized protein n=1 Tax=Harvfovirus sp. TaxID=2487768 RepID=A0A3G5A5M0_9VIRU|nr:MAG: hypothetical protein Harvfovirus63_7 [Harvfovirus sp.]